MLEKIYYISHIPNNDIPFGMNRDNNFAKIGNFQNFQIAGSNLTIKYLLYGICQLKITFSVSKQKIEISLNSPE